MKPTQYERLERLFLVVRALPPNGRAEYLAGVSDCDPGLRAELERLLRYDDRSRESADALASGGGARALAEALADSDAQSDGNALSPAAPALPRQIGRYTIIREIGQGGMGAVYEAEQSDPQRRVALKIIRPGALSPELISRFHREAQMLGRLRHRGIAQIYDAQTSPAGEEQPYIVMELVHGLPLLAFAGEAALDTRQRLSLIADVCDALDHAHQQGLIHRDLKPSNILVESAPEFGSHGLESGQHARSGMPIADRRTVNSQAPQPKILDFGVARSTDLQTLSGAESGRLIGTVPYMSPEQATGRVVDARSDIYAMGVITFELLTRRLPYDLAGKMIHESARIILHEEPTRLSTIDRSLRGDVETIVAKALEKDKSRRYQSVAELAADIRRHLGDEPITARPPAVLYQVQKFARRNRALVGGLAAAFVALMAGLAATTVMYLRADAARESMLAQRDRAEREAQRATVAESQAQLRAAELEKLAEFQASRLSGIDTGLMGKRLRTSIIDKRRAALEGDGTTAQAVEQALAEMDQSLAGVNFTNVALESLEENIFERALAAIDAQFAEQPLLRARLLHTVATTMRSLGLLARASAPQQEALDIRRRELGDAHPETLLSINNMGVLLSAQGKTLEAEQFWREALDTRRRVLGNDHPETLLSISNMGYHAWKQGKSAEAEPFWREALERRRRVLGDDDPDTLTSIHNMGLLLQQQGRFAEAEPYCRGALEGSRRVMGEDHPETLSSIGALGLVLREQGKLAEAEPYYREAAEKARRVLGDDHPNTLAYLNNLGALLRRKGQLTESETYLREALDGRRRVLGPDHADTLASVNSMGVLLRQQGRLAEAEESYRQTMESSRRVLGADNPATLRALNNLGALMRQRGHLSEAEPYVRAALEGRRRVLGGRHPDTLNTIESMALLVQQQGRLSEAEPYFRELLETRRRVLGDGHAQTLTSMDYLGGLLQNLGQVEEAEQLAAEAVRAARAAMPPGNLRTGLFLARHARALAALGRFEEAEVAMLEAHSVVEARTGSENKQTCELVQELADLYDAWRAADPSRVSTRQADEWRQKLDAPPTDNP